METAKHVACRTQKKGAEATSEAAEVSECTSELDHEIYVWRKVKCNRHFECKLKREGEKTIRGIQSTLPTDMQKMEHPSVVSGIPYQNGTIICA